MTSARTALVVLLLSTCVGVGRATPQAPAETATLAVETPAACASRADLIARVLSRSPQIRFVNEPGALQVRVKFTEHTSGNVVAEVVLLKAGAEATSRQLVARSCAQASDAVALVIAVTLDPGSTQDASQESRGTFRDSRSRSTAESSPGASTPKGAERQARPEKPSEPMSAAPGVERDSTAEFIVPRVFARSRFGAHLAVASFVGVAPRLMPGVGASALLALDREALWSPSVVVGVVHAWTTGVQAQGGKAAFRLSAASVDACPFRFVVSPFEARPCGSLLLGLLGASGSETSNPSDPVVRPFIVAGGAAVVTFRLAATLELSARAGAGVTLVRDSFEFGSVVFHTASPVTAFASLGVGIRSP